VALLALPVPLQVRASEHVDELLREFEHLAATDSDAHAKAPGQLLRLRDDLSKRFAAFSQVQQTRLQDAITGREDTLDLHYEIPADAADACVELSAALDEADRYCAEGDYLLTLQTPPDALAYRRWYLGQFVDQIAGDPPTSWPDWRARNADPQPLTRRAGPST
jgi:hypothetical protein